MKSNEGNISILRIEKSPPIVTSPSLESSACLGSPIFWQGLSSAFA